MKTMLAAYLPGNSTFDLREVAVPTPGINQVLIKMKSSGICGSDVHYIYHQHRATAAAPDKPLYQGFINGHEPCGQIVAMGQGCRHFKEGDRVLVYHISGCGFCPNCRRGFPISCTGKGKAAYGWQRDGGHAEYLLAEEKDLDLVKIAPNAVPPVCKIMDYGKFRFEQLKKEKEAKKNQKVVEVKEIRMSPSIDTNDFNTKVKNAQKFLKDGNRVKVTVRFRGREMAHTSLGEQLLKQIGADCDEVATVAKGAKLEGRNMSMFLSPKNSK